MLQVGYFSFLAIANAAVGYFGDGPLWFYGLAAACLAIAGVELHDEWKFWRNLSSEDQP